MKNNIYAIIAGVVVVVLVIFFVAKLIEIEKIRVVERIVRDTVTTYDTIYVRTTITLPSKIDTVEILRDNVTTMIEFAHVDTVIDSDSIYVAYFYPPLNRFNIQISRPRITKNSREVQLVPIETPATIGWWVGLSGLYRDSNPGLGVSLGWNTFGGGVDYIFNDNALTYSLIHKWYLN